MSTQRQDVFESQKDKLEKVAYLYFTHGTLLQEFSALNEEQCKEEWAKYCAISALEIGLNKLGTEMQRDLVMDLHNENTYEEAQVNDKQKCIFNKTKIKKFLESPLNFKGVKDV